MKEYAAKGKKKVRDFVFLEWVSIVGTVGIDVVGFLAIMHQKIMEGTMGADPSIVTALAGINIGQLVYIVYLKRS